MDLKWTFLWFSILTFQFCCLYAESDLHLSQESEVRSEGRGLSLNQKREKRSIFQLKSMIECLIGTSALHFIDYGCYCGMGGKGKPVDFIDNCCKVHDECYGDLANSKLCGSSSAWNEYFTIYNKIGCTWCEPIKSYDKDSYAQCRRKLCECDARVALCIDSNKMMFKKEFIGYDKSRCKV